MLAVDDLFTSYGLAWGVKVIPNTTRNLDKAIGYSFTTIGIKVIFLTFIGKEFTLSLDTITFKVVKFTIDMLETNYLLTILVEVSPFVGTNLDKAVGYGLTWVTIIVTAVGPGTLDLAIIIVEIVVITIDNLSAFNQLTIAIDIVPLVVFRHKAWTGNFTTIAIKEVTLVINSDKVSFNLSSFIVKVILLTVNGL